CDLCLQCFLPPSGQRVHQVERAHRFYFRYDILGGYTRYACYSQDRRRFQIAGFSPKPVSRYLSSVLCFQHLHARTIYVGSGSLSLISGR
ncbi:hypothetical protein L210DRAFT_3558235, partial [Boletus edulis BED1]